MDRLPRAMQYFDDPEATTAQSLVTLGEVEEELEVETPVAEVSGQGGVACLNSLQPFGSLCRSIGTWPASLGRLTFRQP